MPKLLIKQGLWAIPSLGRQEASRIIVMNSRDSGLRVQSFETATEPAAL